MIRHWRNKLPAGLVPEWMRVAVEFRHSSWHCEEVFALLEEHQDPTASTGLAGSYSDADLSW